jgi:hypothetical protein
MDETLQGIFHGGGETVLEQVPIEFHADPRQPVSYWTKKDPS